MISKADRQYALQLARDIPDSVYKMADGTVLDSEHTLMRQDLELLARALLDCELRRDEAERYAKEGWEWLDEALQALGAKTVFDIQTAGAQNEQVRRERMQWEDRYEELLAEVGGTLPS